jgi:hypothetical protein
MVAGDRRETEPTQNSREKTVVLISDSRAATANAGFPVVIQIKNGKLSKACVNRSST